MSHRTKRLVSVLIGKMPVLVNVSASSNRERKPFDPIDCNSCSYNHAHFGDEFEKSGHCYMFVDAPPNRCPQHVPVAASEPAAAGRNDR